jgi:hypothetical protein
VPERPVLRRRLQGEQPRGTGVGVGVVQTGQVTLAGIRCARRQRQVELYPLLAARRRLEHLALDRVARLGEVGDHALHQHRQVRRNVPGAVAGSYPHQGQLAYQVVHVRFGGQQQVGGNVAEADHVGGLAGRWLGVIPGGEEVVQLAGRKEPLRDPMALLGRADVQLAPDGLAALGSLNPPPVGQGGHQREAPAGHPVGAGPGLHRRCRAGIVYRDAKGAAHLNDDGHRGPGVQQRIRDQLGDR